MNSSTTNDLGLSTELLLNPFAVLGATTRDDRRKIVELADEASLSLDHDVCQKARADLTNPRTRLSAEMGWLPGVSPSKAAELLKVVRKDPLAIADRENLPVLAHCNLLTAGFDAVTEKLGWARVEGLVERMVYLVDALEADCVFREINEDRAVSGFPEVRSVELVEEELAERKRSYRTSIQAALNRLYTEDLIEVMSFLVEVATDDGTEHAPEFVDVLVDSYAIETRDFLDKEAANINKLITIAQSKAQSADGVLDQLVASLDVVVRNWFKVAKPLTMSFASRGLDHPPSKEVAYGVRGLAIELFNDHAKLEPARRLTLLIKDVFACLPDLMERVRADEAVLNGVAERHEAESALKPILDLCASVREGVERDANIGLTAAQRVLDTGMRLLKQSELGETSSGYSEGCDVLAMTAMSGVIAYGNLTSKWASCIELLERIKELARDDRLKQKVKENLDTARENANMYGDLEPIQSAPSLRTINGIGFSLYGNTDLIRSNGSYMATYYFVVLFVPLFPLARYRVIPSPGGYRFLGKGKLRGFDQAHIAVSIILILIFLSNL
ncbi:hypothetical protein [Cupriavidus sp. U2]|uniref:hypothetical protein n=1 Tax=Cupriavidus sp. U2 TaxID=2920269 RepID=UPI00129EBD83|nr:hypothetical protein [Cupriavidus sp. U2]